MVAQFGVLVAVLDEHARNEHAFGHRAFAGTGDLEALARVLRETVQVQAVVPVGAANERQAVGTKVGDGKVEAAAQMLHQALCLAGIIIKGHLLVQNRPVAGLAQIGGSAGNEPQRVIVEAGADIAVAFLGQGLVLVVGAAILKLGGGDIQNALPCAGRDDVYKAQQILTAVAEAHAAAGPAFKVAGRAAHIEGDHTLILVPDVHHTVQLFLAGFQMVGGEQSFPVVGQRLAGRVHLCIGGIACDHGMGTLLVDDTGSRELFVLWVLDVAQTEEDLLFLTRCKGDMDVQRAHRCPAVGNAAGAVPGADGLRVCRAAIHTAEGIAGGIKAGNGRIAPEYRIVIAALTVFRLMVDDGRLHLHLAGGEVALEVGAVVNGIPQAELHIAEHIQLFYGIRLIFQSQAVQLTGIAGGHEQFLRSGNTVLLTLQNGIAQTVAAGVAVQLCLGGLPAGVPDGIAILDVNVVAVHIQRGAVIAVAGQAAHPRIAVKAVAARRV